MSLARRRRRVVGAVTGAVLALATAVPGLAGPPATTRADAAMAPARAAGAGTPASTTAARDVRTQDVSPLVARGSQSVTVRVVVRNSSERTLTDPVLTVVQGTPGTGRAAVRAWAGSTDLATGPVLGQTRIDGRIRPGASRGVRVTVPRLAQRAPSSWGAVAVSLQLADDPSTEFDESDAIVPTHTFLGFQRAKEYVPLRQAVLVPLTLPPDATLFGPRGQARLEAWRAAIGPRSSIARAIEAGRGRDVVWAIDPTLLTPARAERGAGTADAAERRLRQAVARTLRALMSRDESIVLPMGDADVVAGTQSESGRELVARQHATAVRVAGRHPRARADVAWPADGLTSQERTSALRGIFDDEDPVQLVAGSALPASGLTPTSAHRVEGEDDAVIAVQDDRALVLDPAGWASADRRMAAIADSAALVAEAAGTDRSVVLALPRGGAGDSRLPSALAARDAAPWLAPASFSTASRPADGAGALALPATDADAAATASGTAAPSIGGSTVLTGARSARIEQLLTDLEAIAEVRGDGSSYRADVREAARQLASTRYRTAPREWLSAIGTLQRQARGSRGAVGISSGEVNFFADNGRLQVTIVNTLDVRLEGVRIVLEPGDRRLRITPPEPISIGPRARRTVTVRATALASGNVPVRVQAQTPDGAAISQPASLRLYLRPTGSWIYWAIGGAAGLLLVLGTWRTRNRARRAATTGAPPDPTSDRTDPTDPQGESA